MKSSAFFFGFLLLVLVCSHSFAQVGINIDAPNPRAVLDLHSPTNDQGLLVPRLTTSQRTATAFTSGLSESENGLLIFDIDTQLFYYWISPSWKAVEAGANNASWRSGTSAPDNSIGAEGDFFLNILTGDVFKKYSGTYELALNIKGGMGSQGPTGPVGLTGPAGPQGPKGDAGEKGDLGLQGPVGQVGSQGAPGLQGLKGDTGDVGSVGPQGLIGPAGVIGPQGVQGIQGAKGDTGLQGAQGPTGATGAIGPQGIQGIKGDTGETGPVGADGPIGPVGVVGAQGIQGLKGDTGDTGSAGPQGIQGIKGDMGDTGPVGPVGSAGADGLQGIQGIQGIKGDLGDPGPTGPQGPAGPIGLQGIQGVKGDAGATGAQGPIGLTGLQGPQGIPGVSTAFTARSVSSNYTATGLDDVIIVLTGGTTITLPSAGSVPGKMYHIRHHLALLDLGSVTIRAPAGNSIIDGSPAQTFTIGLLNPTAITVIAIDTDKWYVIGKF